MSSALATQQFFSPVNVGVIDNPDGAGNAASVNCGALVRVSLSVDNDQRITAAKFKVTGCSYLVGTCSILSEVLGGKTTAAAAVLCQKPEVVGEMMGNDLAEDKAECIALACKGFISAIRNYSDSVRSEWSEDEALICTCFSVSERAIETAVKTGRLRTIAEVTQASNAGAGCQSCYPLIEEILDQFARADCVFD